MLTKVAIIVPTMAQPVTSGLENNLWLHVPHDCQQDQSVYQKRHQSIPKFFSLRLIYYIYSVSLACVPKSQKRASDPITDGCEPPCGCWELNLGPLEEQSVFLTTEPSLQSLLCTFSTLYNPGSAIEKLPNYSH